MTQVRRMFSELVQLFSEKRSFRARLSAHIDEMDFESCSGHKHPE
jgi:hypothetical protein